MHHPRRGWSADRAALPTPASDPLNAGWTRWGWATAFALALFGLLAWSLSAWYAMRADAHRTGDIARDLAIAVANQLEHGQYAAHAMVPIFGPAEPSQGQFKTIAQGLLHGLGPGVTLQWAPQAVISYIEPLAGNEAALGLDMLAHPRRRPPLLALIEGRQPLWAGPIELVQGGRGLAYQVPIFQPQEQGGDFRGLSITLFKFPDSLPSRLSPQSPLLQGEEDLRVPRQWRLWLGSDRGRMHQVFATPAAEPASAWSISELALLPFKRRDNQAWWSEKDEPGSLLIRVEVSQARLIDSANPAVWIAPILAIAALGGWIAAQGRRRRLEQRLAEALGEELHHARQILDQAVTGMALFKPNGDCVQTNEAMARMAGATWEPVKGTNLWQLEGWQGTGLLDLARATLDDGQPRQRSFQGPGSWSPRLALSVHYSRLYLAGQPHLLLQALDLSDLFARQQALEAARQEAEAANRAKSQFLANMSHEMRTPLNALLGYGRLLETAPLEDEHRELVHKLNQAGQALLALVDDVLDLTKIEAGEFHLAQEPLDLSATLDQVRSLMAASAAQKGLDLVVEPLPAGLPRHYLADPPRLRQILVNLVGNALKFTSRGQVRLGVQALVGDDPTHQRLRFEVSDTGIGISAADQARLFARFQQLQDDNRRRFGGTGLGLAIVKELAERLGGGVDVRSTPGVGSTFGVEVRLEIARAQTRQQTGAGNDDLEALPGPEHLRLDGLRLLVVDDSDVNRDVAQRLLKAEGAEVQACADGQQALDWLRAPGQAVDLVLMDVQMPVMDGNTAVTLMRQDPALKEVPVIAMTAGATRSERDSSLQAGMDAYLTKPFEPEQLLRLIRRQICQRRGQPLPPGRLRVTAATGSAQAGQLPSASPPAWPEIPGIDAGDAKARLGGDLDLFTQSLSLFLDEFGDLRQAPPPPATAAAREALARRLHKLAGGAGQLGAQALFRLGKAAETSLKAAEREDLEPLLAELAAHLAVLAAAATPHLGAAVRARAELEAAEASQGVLALDATALAELKAQLAGRRMKALPHYRQLVPGLRRFLASDDFKRLEAAMERLDFQAALEVLAGLEE